MLVRYYVCLLRGHLVVAVHTGLSSADYADTHASLAADGLVLARGLRMSNLV